MSEKYFQNNEEDNEEKKSFFVWIFSYEFLDKKELTIKEKIKIADKKRINALSKEDYLDAAKYRDVIKNLKK